LKGPHGTRPNQPLAVIAEHTNGAWPKHLRDLNGLFPTIGIDLSVQAFSLAKSGAFAAMHTL